MPHTWSEKGGSEAQGERKAKRVSQGGRFSEGAAKVRKAFFERLRGANRSDPETAPRNPLQKRMQSGGG
jgi:hypothetical protein